MTRSTLRLTSDGTNLTAAFSADGQTFTPVGRPAALAGIDEPEASGCSRSTAAPPRRWSTRRSTGSSSRRTRRPEPVDPSDEFTGDALDKCRWNAIVREDPATYRVTDGALRIDVPNGDIYTANNTGPTNFILQNAPSGDWTMETKVDGSLLNEQYQQAGLLVYGDDDNYLKLDFIVDNAAGQPVSRRIEFRSEIGAAVQNPQPQVTNLTSAVWHLRLARAGNTYTASYSADGTEWTTFEPLTNAAVGATPKVGLFSLGAAQTGVEDGGVRLLPAHAPGTTDTTAPVTARRGVRNPGRGLVHRRRSRSP